MYLASHFEKNAVCWAKVYSKFFNSQTELESICLKKIIFYLVVITVLADDLTMSDTETFADARWW